MRNAILKYIVVFALVAVSGAMLLDVSQQVQEVEREIRHIDRSIEREQENIRVLQAEWAYLNDPARLELIAMSGLGMGAPSPEDVVSGFEIVDDMGVNNASEVSVFQTPTRKPQQNLVRNISFSAPSQIRGAQ